MNTNIILQCNLCLAKIHCRIGFSRDKKQEFRFICQNCRSPIDVVLELNFKNISWKIKPVGATKYDSDEYSCADHFVDLHLDFPTYSGKYVPGQTPFIRAAMLIGNEKILEYQHVLKLLEGALESKGDLNAIIRFYIIEKNDLFRKIAYKYLPKDEFKSDKQIDINRCLYQLIDLFFMAFHRPADTFAFVDSTHNELSDINNNSPQTFHNFIKKVISTGFLKTVQHDCLTLYPRIMEAETILRPVLFLDFTNNVDGMIPHKISTASFGQYKDLYKDISEVLSRLLVIVAGISNIKMRKDYNLFDIEKPQHPKNLDEYVDFALGKKPDFIDDARWRKIAEEAVDNKLRNSIAHYKTEYDEINQIIICYPKLEGLDRKDSIKLTFLEFMKKMLDQFRWVHRLNHLVKMLYVFYYLEVIKESAE